jgi:hypothetical protein
MQTVLGRATAPTVLLVTLVLVVVLLSVVAVMLWISGVPYTEPLVGPFRWAPRPLA